MADDSVTPPVEPSEGMSADDLKALFSTVFDEKIGPVNERLDGIKNGPDLETFRTSLLEDMGKLVAENRGKEMDEQGMLDKIGGLIDDKIKGLPRGTSSTKRSGGPLSRFLGISG